MPIEHILSLLIAERDKLNRAIEALGGIVAKRRGRPPKNPGVAIPIAASNLAPPVVKARRGRTFSAAQRKAQAARMKAYWAKRKKWA
jgi:hypothetical protein